MYKPKKFKYKKMQKKKIKNYYITFTNKILDLNFGVYDIKSIEKGLIKLNQIESVRKSLSKEIKKLGKIWIRVFSTIVRSSKPAEVRMGKGKGNADYWAAPVKSGQILFEISNIKFSIAKNLLKKVSYKLPILTQFIKKYKN